MKRAVRYSPKAKSDLDGIWNYSLNLWGAERADAYIRSIHSTFNLIDQFPAIVRNASDIRPGLLKYSVGSHVVYLRMNEQSIDVVRILHQQMDYPRHL
ncbi:type II toxin-antitoxin system RelE/ParE family toxin [Mesorhizobium sp. BH1-1-5]|uniref:type II toxin-antitoxin system RelE/ParE family toxin n=1 Tax=unclassified Mesorhizobium TaxID=325217 RepID=UPI00112AA39E|nr:MULTISPECIES: type II toxin-antitoxin system RelE/ParE family toxin [unclassified Mesorhizobium]MBZ9986754.1 type II toxin-antitoxin system RelE/ParE family toxin [Mesorhizobium sp. BH1-1-5]TPJ64811.1 type II toxin-antitoxin system RelE/ParE family toxin [Mesorhizobium sp. B2-7-1]